MMEAVHGTNPLWYLLGTVVVVVGISGVYLVIRHELTGADPREESEETTARSADREGGAVPEGATNSAGGVNPESQPCVLDLLPDDEGRILEPVRSSPGVTQIELRDRSDCSKSKVSQAVSALEKRGLLYRERQGRTYRIYPSEELKQNHPD